MALTRRFSRGVITDMGSEVFDGLYQACISQVHWDQHEDCLVFVIPEHSWTWLVLQYPELARNHMD